MNTGVTITFIVLAILLAGSTAAFIYLWLEQRNKVQADTRQVNSLQSRLREIQNRLNAVNDVLFVPGLNQPPNISSNSYIYEPYTVFVDLSNRQMWARVDSQISKNKNCSPIFDLSAVNFGNQLFGQQVKGNLDSVDKSRPVNPPLTTSPECQLKL